MHMQIVYCFLERFLRFKHCSGVVASGSFKKKCLKDSTVPEYPVNVYYCYDEWKAVCCTENLEYGCCEPDESIVTYVIHVTAAIWILMCYVSWFVSL